MSIAQIDTLNFVSNHNTQAMQSPEPKLGLALSGGGYRAAAFHLGTLNKLNSMRILSKVDVISTISGGSILGACYCTRKGDFDSFYDDVYQALQKKDVIKSVLLSWIGLRIFLLLAVIIGSFYFLFSPYPWIFPIIITLIVIILLKYQFKLLPISKRIEEIYDRFFYKNSTLSNLPGTPLLVIGATNLQTARGFYFSKTWMHDSTYEFLDDPVKFIPGNFPLSRAVMASSCVPFAFTPVTIDKEFFEDPDEAERVHPLLVDGAVYDNQGIHKIVQAGRYACPVVITSDAGAGSTGELSFRNTISLLTETVNVFMSRIKKAQMVRNVYDNASTAKREIAYFSLGWDVENCIDGFISNLGKKQITQSVIDAHELKPEWIANPEEYRPLIAEHLKARIGYAAIDRPENEEKAIARSVGTNLMGLSKRKLDCLIKQAKALTEAQVKLYCPSLI